MANTVELSRSMHAALVHCNSPSTIKPPTLFACEDKISLPEGEMSQTEEKDANKNSLTEGGKTQSIEKKTVLTCEELGLDIEKKNPMIPTRKSYGFFSRKLNNASEFRSSMDHSPSCRHNASQYQRSPLQSGRGNPIPLKWEDSGLVTEKESPIVTARTPSSLFSRRLNNASSFKSSMGYSPSCSQTPQYERTPLHSGRGGNLNPHAIASDTGVSCNRCRPSFMNKESPAVIILTELQEMIGLPHKLPNSNEQRVLKSWFFSKTKKTPKKKVTSEEDLKLPAHSPSPAISEIISIEEDLKQKLVEASIRRDVALTEVSELRSSMAELEKKLRKLELYCRHLKHSWKQTVQDGSTAGPEKLDGIGLKIHDPRLDEIGLKTNDPRPNEIGLKTNDLRTNEIGLKAYNSRPGATGFKTNDFRPDAIGFKTYNSRPDEIGYKTDESGIEASDSRPVTYGALVKCFLQAVAEARAAVRQLSRTLVIVLQDTSDGEGLEKLNSLLQPYEVHVGPKISRCEMYHLEAIMNQAFYEDFESSIFQKNGAQIVLDPHENCVVNFSSFHALRNLGWDEVVSKGTRFFSEDFSRFCDQKMGLIVSMLHWTSAWPEQLLQVFFTAAKCVWLVHLLAFSFYPPLFIFRVDKTTKFDSVYMEDVLGDRQTKQACATVRIMVTPGFYVYNNVIKCKVLCSHTNQP